MMRNASLALAAASVLAAVAAGLPGCGNGDDKGPTPPDASIDGMSAADGTVAEGSPSADGGPADGGSDGDATAARDAGDTGTDAKMDAPGDARDAGPDTGADAGDAGRADGGDAGDAGDAAAPTATFLVHLDATQLPEGLWLLDGGTPIVSFAELATLATVSDGGAQVFGVIEAGAPTAFTLGITTDPSGNLYVGVGSFTPDAGPIPAPGVYKFPPTGGPGTLFSSTPTMNFANGLDVINGQLFVADSEGTIYTVDLTSGTPTPWSSDPLLLPDPTACDAGPGGSPIGANGIVDDTTGNVYVTNTNFGRVVKIPILADGGAGAATTVVENCSALAGADGLVYDPKDGSLIVAVNQQNKIVRVSGATTSVITSGPPLDFPASVVIQSTGADAGRHLLFTNFALTSGDAGLPGLLSYPIP
jgi:hypothetical protein